MSVINYIAVANSCASSRGKT